MERFVAGPTTSMPKKPAKAGEGNSGVPLLRHQNAGSQAILAPHWQQTQQCTAALAAVLCSQDMTELNLNEQGAFALDPLSYEAQQPCICSGFMRLRPVASHSSSAKRQVEKCQERQNSRA